MRADLHREYEKGGGDPLIQCTRRFVDLTGFFFLKYVVCFYAGILLKNFVCAVSLNLRATLVNLLS